jgi:hypothetical protein
LRGLEGRDVLSIQIVNKNIKTTIRFPWKICILVKPTILPVIFYFQ